MSARKEIVIDHYKTTNRVEGDDYIISQYDWTQEFFLQGGKEGIVFTREGSRYVTAFVEAVSSGRFIRGEGDSVEAAETDAWEKYQAIEKCDHPEYVTKGYTNGAGFCVSCGEFKPRHFTGEQLGQFCSSCNEGTTWGTAYKLRINKNHERTSEEVWTCEEHYAEVWRTYEAYLLRAVPADELTADEMKNLKLWESYKAYV